MRGDPFHPALDPAMLESLRQTIHHAPADEFWPPALVCLIAACVLFWLAAKRFHKLQWVAHTPTSKVRSAAQGYVELDGIARNLDGEPIFAPLTRTPCTWFSYSVSRRTRDGQNRERFRTVEEGTSDHLFALDDDTGRCVVDPEGATVMSTHRDVWYGNSRYGSTRRVRLGFGRRYRFEERRIMDGDPLFALGDFRTLGAAVGDRNTDIVERLREWKQDRASLVARFDSNGDGEVDVEEWEMARAAAAAEIDAERAGTPAAEGFHCLAAGGAGPMLLATRTERQVMRALRLSVALTLTPAVLLFAGGLWSMAERLNGAG